MISTLCTSCNRPAPEYDSYQSLAQNILVQIAQGITIIRWVNQKIESTRKDVPVKATQWVADAETYIHSASDFREAQPRMETVHADCPEWKQTTRRLNALTIELDFMRRDLIGHFVPRHS